MASVIFWKHLSLPTPFIFVKSEAKERERAFKGFSKRREKKRELKKHQEVLGFKKPKSKVRACNLSDFAF